ncbi:MAG TPA: PAS domain S-box protein [candidate division Zixibacteria bacterium]|nr:PAS domain S-box protein [candidate division Zixibacteria bacterium]
MNSHLKVLHLEDNRNDAELVKETLLMNDFKCDIILVDNKEDFVSELKKGNLGIILADYNLPNFDGLEALSIAKKEMPDIPFIFISGVLGEELAIETLKKGATDYVIKSRLERLIPAVNRALKEKEERAERIKLEREIAELDQLADELRSTYDQLTRRVRGFLKIEIPSGKYTVVDRFLEDLSGYKLNNWKETPNFIKNIIHSDFAQFYQESIDQMLEGIIPKLLEYKIVREDGEERWWLQFNIGAFDSNGNLTSVSAVIIDNSENKEAQIKYQNLFENALVGMYRSDIKTGEIIEANERMAEIFGYKSAEEFKEHNAYDFHIQSEERNGHIQVLTESGSYEELILQYKRTDGSLVWVSESARIYLEEGYIEGMMVDISDRKVAEDAIKRDRKAFQIIAEATTHSTSIPELCQRIIDGLVETLGFDAGTIRLFNPKDNLLYPIAISIIEENDKNKLTPVSIDDSNHIGARVARTRNAIFIPDTAKDILLKTTKPQLESVPVRAVITSPILSANNELLGVMQLIAQEPKEIPEEDKILFETIAGQFTNALEHQKSTEALQESEEKFRAFAEQSLVGVALVNIANEFLFVNDVFAKISEYTPEELYTIKADELMSKIFSEEDKQAIQSMILRIRKNLTPVNIDCSIKTKTGKSKWISINIAPILRKNVYDMVGILVQDITDKKRAQMTLERERQAFSILAEAIVKAEDIPDLCNRIIDGLLETLNFDIGTFRLYDQKTQTLHPIAVVMEDRTKISEIKTLQISDKTYLNTHVARTKEPIFAPDISKHNIAMKYYDRLDKFGAKANITWPILDGKNNLLGTIQIIAFSPKEFPEEDRFFFETIVRFFASALERKWSEQALFESKEQYRRLIETSPFAIINTDLNGKVIMVNQQALNIFSFTKEEDLLGIDFFTFFSDIEQIKRDMQDTIKFGTVRNYEYTIQNRIGEEIIIELSTSVILNEKQEPETFIFIGQDISERKVFEKEQLRLTNIITHSEQVVMSATPDGIIIYVNPAMEQIFGYTQEEIIGKSISILSPPGQEKVQKEMFERVKNLEKITIESIRKHKDGTLIPIILTITTNRDENGNLLSINGIIVDISSIKKLEESLKSKYEEIEVFNKVISAGYQANTLPEFLDIILDEILSSLSFTGGVIYLIDEMNQKANIERSKGVPKNLLKNIQSVGIQTPQFKRLFVDGETIILSDFKNLEESHMKLGLSSLLSVPFLSKDKIIGALMLISTPKREFTEENKKMLEAIGRDVGTVITKFKAEEEIITSERNLQSIFDALDDLLFVLDASSKQILNANKTTKRIFGFSEMELFTKTLFDLQITGTDSSLNEKLTNLLDGKLKRLEIPVLMRDGIKFNAEISAYKEKYAGRDAIICLIRLLDE